VSDVFTSFHIEILTLPESSGKPGCRTNFKLIALIIKVASICHFVPDTLLAKELLSERVVGGHLPAIR